MRLGLAIENQVLPYYRKPFPRLPQSRLPTGRMHRVRHPLYAIVGGQALDYESYRAGVSSGELPARAIHGPMHAARSALWAGLIATLRGRTGAKHGADLFDLQMAAAFHDAARQDEGIDRWERESAELFDQWHKGAGSGRKTKFTKSDRSILLDADTLEILRVLASLQHFQIERLSIVKERRVGRRQIRQFVHEVSLFVQLSENTELKKDLESSGELYFS